MPTPTDDTTDGGVQPPTDDASFDEDLAAEHTSGGHVDESVLAVDDDRALRHGLPGMDAEQVRGLSILTAGTSLDQGSVYIDLDHLDRGPFKALGGQRTGPSDRLVAKRDTDYETWDRLVGRGTV